MAKAKSAAGTDKAEGLEHVRHSLAHLMAAAVTELYPGTKNTIGPVIENGFYYDFEFPSPITEEDLPKIEAKMRELLPTWHSFERKEVTAAEARKHFADNPYKLELIDEFAGEGSTITLYTSGTFTDLCRGGHVDDPTTINPNSFALDRIAGAYWRGDEKNTMLTRIYGLAFSSKEELDAYRALVEEAKKRDHKLLGRELKLFTFSPLVGSGLPLYMPNGTILRDAILSYVTELKRVRDYRFVWTPHLAKEDLYKKSGHLGKYDAMLPPLVTSENERFIVKPMNCPHHFQIYNAEKHSYRDLPYRIAENATDYRNEKSGELNGLLRVRSLTQDDTHHMVRHTQIAGEIDMIIKLIETVFTTFGFTNFRARISTRDPKDTSKYFGTEKLWDEAEGALIAAAKRWGVEYFIGEGEAAFYGPKIDVLVKDALGREWQLSTVQLDYVQPENFDMTYTNEGGAEERPAVLHVAILGSLDRFLGIIIEHFGGNFPVWLSPTQVRILPIGEKHQAYAQEVAAALRTNSVRTELDDAGDTLGKRIREAELKKVPYLLVLGDKEVEAKAVNVRKRHVKETTTVPLDDFLKVITQEIADRA
jgi:threonyl-tRNA synthetase